jgi:hypothetical protein
MEKTASIGSYATKTACNYITLPEVCKEGKLTACCNYSARRSHLSCSKTHQFTWSRDIDRRVIEKWVSDKHVIRMPMWQEKDWWLAAENTQMNTRGSEMQCRSTLPVEMTSSQAKLSNRILILSRYVSLKSVTYLTSYQFSQSTTFSGVYRCLIIHELRNIGYIILRTQKWSQFAKGWFETEDSSRMKIVRD